MTARLRENTASSRRLRRDEGGAALIEAALVLPVLLLLVLIAAELAIYLWQAGAARKAVELGVRTAAVSTPIAAGPGLTPAESAGYWDGLPLGGRCDPGEAGRGLCPEFAVVCSVRDQCACPGFGRCEFRFVEARLAPVLAAMRAALPGLRADQVEIGYATNFLGYVGRPLPVPVDVTVRLVALTHRPLFFAERLGPSLPLAATATLPSGRMRSDEGV